MYVPPGPNILKYLDPRNVRTPRSKYFEIFGPPKCTYPPVQIEIFAPPLKYLDRMRGACCLRMVNYCTENGRPSLARSWDEI